MPVVTLDATRGLAWHERALVRSLRALPAGLKGKARLARLLCRSLLDRRDVAIATRQGDLLTMPTLREPVAFMTLIDGNYEADLTQFVERLLSKGGTFLDVGANVGAFALRAAHVVGAAGKVVAIEASPAILPYLKRNVAASGATNITLVEQAVTDRGPTTVKFWTAPADHFGMGSLAPQFHDLPEEIEADTIDHILASLGITHVDLVKMDIEGFELAAFRGARGLLTGARRPVVAFEFADWAELRGGFSAGEAQRFLQALDYDLHTLDDGRLEPLATPMTRGSANIIAVPRGVDLSLIGERS